MKAFTVLDESVRTALASAVVDSNRDLLGRGGESLNGFNAHPETDLAKAGAPLPDKDVGTKTDGWAAEGEATFTGPTWVLRPAAPSTARRPRPRPTPTSSTPPRRAP
ncbi:hypothetical protein ACODT5_16350 [Streptomyces sp. 5.8]|uniref:hypothetical protein n=1 Tax=Streptomyces sp. 5.8 TaxID=3406571 RepID=UPI003BB58FD2